MHSLQIRFALANVVSRSFPRIALIAIAFGLAGISGTNAMAQSASEFEPTWFMVVDWANLLDQEQEVSAINDTWRLNLLRVPAQVVTELEESTPELARQRAESLRIEHAIESYPGADDGILIYAAVNPANRTLVTVAISAGPDALPSGGLTQEMLVTIEQSIVVPQLTAGHPARAIVYAVREMIYQQEFTPPPSVPLSGWKKSVNAVLPWLAPVVVIPVAVVSLRDIRLRSGIRPTMIRAAMATATGLLLGVVAIAAQSGPGVFWAIALVLVSLLVAIMTDRQSGRPDHGKQTQNEPDSTRQLQPIVEVGS